MRRLSAIAFFGILLLLATASSGQAAGGHGAMGGHGGFSGHGAGGHFDGHHGFDHHFDGHHFHPGFHGGVVIGAPFFWGAYPYAPYYPYDPYYDPAPTYTVPAPPTYWYYCASAGGYYPTVPACPESWVQVPAQ